MKPKKLLSFILAMVMAISLLPTFTITSAAENADVTFSAVDGTKGNSGENYTNLFDGKNSQASFSKWCVQQHTAETYVVIKASEAVILTGYTFITGNDTYTYQGRNPKAWKLYGSNNYNENDKEGTWSLISSVADGEMPVNNFTSKTFDVDCDKEYKYFKFVIEAIVSTDNNTLFQLCGMEFKFNTVSESIVANKNITLGTPALKGGQASNLYFGTYQQSSLGNTEPAKGTEGIDWIKNSNGQINGQGAYYKKEPIKWRVLSNTDGKAFLLSDKNLDVLEYYYGSYENDINWETSTLRSWLNGTTTNDFYGSAFSENEKNLIATTKVINATYDGTEGTNPNPSYNTPGGDDTDDKVFLLSIAEALNTSYFTDDNSRKAFNTYYVYGGGKLGAYSMNKVNQSDIWWLRSPGQVNHEVAYIRSDGVVSNVGIFADCIYSGVRPAFNLNLQSVLFTSAANGGKTVNVGKLSKNTEIQNYEYKLTILDSSRNFALTDTSEKIKKRGSNISLEYELAETGDNEYISAMIVNSDNEVLYYGQVKQATKAKDEVSFAIPSDIDYGEYELRLFNEQINGNEKTDISSGFATVKLTIGDVDVCGDGTSENPYLIYNLDQLEYFRSKLNDGDTYVCGKLMNDIVINPGTFACDGTYTPAGREELQKWTPFGKLNIGEGYTDSAYIYAGTFDGNGKTISGLYFNDSYSDYVGLFARVDNGAEIKDLNIKNSYFNGKDYVGSVVGYAKPNKIDNSNSSFIALNKTPNVSVKNCRSEAVVCGNQYVGGIAGYAKLTEKTPDFLETPVLNLQNCHNVGEVKCNGDSVGGIIGYVNVSTGIKANVKQCSNTGKVSGVNNVGGIVGYADVAAVNTTETQYESDFSSGSFVLKETTIKISDGSAVVVSDCYNTSEVCGTSFVGGIAGYAKLTYSDEANSGGLIGGTPTDGIQEVIVSRCFNIGTVSGTEKTGSISGYAVYEHVSTPMLSNPSLTTITECYCKIGTANAGMGYGTDTTVAKDAEAFVGGEVAYLLQGNDTASVWGQNIGTDMYPIFDGASVYEDEYNGIKAYRNEIDGYKILRQGTDNKSATVMLEEAGTYAIVFADYDSSWLENLKIFEVTVTEPQAVRVISDKDFTLDTGDKIMLWDNFAKLTPLCEVYEVK